MTLNPAMHITGKTRIYGLVGDPVITAKSPALWNQFFIDQGVDAVCIPFWVQADDLAAFVIGARAMRNLSGLLVTMPHKQAMLTFVDDLQPTARQAQALNVVRREDDGRWTGAMFDGVGGVLGMKWDGGHPADQAVLLLGAGGSGRAIAFAVAAAGCRELAIFDVDERRAKELADSVTAATGCETYFSAPDPRGYGIVINATPLGMRPDDPMPINPDRLEPGTFVVDITTAPAPTPLLRAAQARGCRTQDGRPLHEGQAVYTMRFLGFDYRPNGRSASDLDLPSLP